jgi:hypothetical protein
LFSASATPLESVANENTDIRFLVALFSKDFDIEPSVQHLLLPKNGESNVLTFNICAKREGKLDITICFYYKLNLLHAISVPLNVTSLELYGSKTESDEEILETELIHSVKNGLDSVLAVEMKNDSVEFRTRDLVRGNFDFGTVNINKANIVYDGAGKIHGRRKKNQTP